MVDDTLRVTGGAGGIAADYADMLTRAELLERLAGTVSDRLATVTRLGADPDLLASGVLSPGTLAQVEEQVLAVTAGPHGLVATAARLEATALTLRTSVTAYQAVDASQRYLTGTFEEVAALPSLLAPVAFTDVQVWAEFLSGRWDLVPGTLDRTGDRLMNNLYTHPWIVDGVIEGAPGLLRTLSGDMALLTGGSTALATINAWTSTQEGTPFPPANLEQASADVVAMGQLFGWFRRGTGVAAPTSAQDGRPVAWQTPGIATHVPPPTSVQSLIDGVGTLYGPDNSSRIRIVRVPQTDGTRRWIVELPGTEEWSPEAGRNPLDLTNNLRLMAGQDAEQNDAIRSAMRQAGIAPIEPVLIAGHSQGGITAASLASDPETRREFRITNIVTAGSPIARFAIPDDVSVLSIEHQQDAVPRLDGEPNPDRPNWITVQRDPTGLPGASGPVDTTAEAHGIAVYRETAGLIDRSRDASLTQARAGLTEFLNVEPSKTAYHDYEIRRNIG